MSTVARPAPPVEVERARARRAPAERYRDLRDRVDARTRAIVEERQRSPRARRDRVVPYLLPLADAAGVTVAFVTAVLANGGGEGDSGPGLAAETALLVATLPGWLVLARLYGLYRRDSERADYSTADDAPALLNVVTLGVWLFYAAAHLAGTQPARFGELASFWLLALVFVLVTRAVARAVARRSPAATQNALILGAGDVGVRVGEKLTHHPEYGINLVGFVDDAPAHGDGTDHAPVLGPTSELLDIARAFQVDRVIVAFSEEPDERTLDHVRMLTDEAVRVDIVPRLFEVIGETTSVHSVEGVPLLTLPPLRLPRSARIAKRCLDIVGATCALVVASPLLAAIALLVKLDSPGPVFFRQTRIGESGRPFRIWKFRTMSADADARKEEVSALNKHLGRDPRMFKIPSDPRATRAGRTLRRLSLDELPQLFNVLSGQMSLVGPRPLIPDEHRHVTDWARTRLRLRPGITGLWQVLGRSEIPFEEMVRLDYLYVTTWSLWSDVRILARTAAVLWGSRGAY